MIYDVDFFINKFERIPEELWCIGMQRDGEGRFCAVGHCQSEEFKKKRTPGNTLRTMEADILVELFDDYLQDNPARVNNGGSDRYQQPTPKQRILAALRDIKSAQEKAQQPQADDRMITGEVKEKVVYVTVDSSVRELQQKELSVN